MSKRVRTSALILIGTVAMLSAACSSSSTPSTDLPGTTTPDTAAGATIDVAITDTDETRFTAQSEPSGS